jgi:hypothetical protein
LERAQKKYPDGVVIAIDDLDKQNPNSDLAPVSIRGCQRNENL